jgi:hypothetical protein
MKFFFSFICLSFIFSLTAKAQIGPKATFDTLRFDFGKVKQGENPTHIFNFYNSGDAPFIIEDVKTTCSCTASDWPREPVKPGEKNRIKVTFDTEGKEGQYAKGVNLITNAGEINLIIFVEVFKE